MIKPILYCVPCESKWDDEYNGVKHSGVCGDCGTPMLRYNLIPVESHISDIVIKDAKTLSNVKMLPDSYHSRIQRDAKIMTAHGFSNALYQTSNLSTTMWKLESGEAFRVHEDGCIS